jgi:CHAT domain-containing protein/tetratricopeptide (TPR) repeat protein
MIEALSLAKDELDAIDRLTQSNPKDLTNRLFDVAVTLVALDRLDEAIDYLNRALSTAEGEAQELRGKIANTLATALARKGKVTVAEALLKALVELHTTMGLIQKPDLSQSHYDLGNLQRELGRLDEAWSSYQSSLNLRQSLLGSSHPDVAASLVGLANVFWQNGKYFEAKPLYERAIVILDTSQNADHPTLAVALNNYAATLVELGRFTEALSLHQRALGIREKSLGPEHYEVSLSLNNLGNVYRELGRLFEAQDALRRALFIREKIVTSEGAGLAPIINNLARVYAAMGRSEEAEAFYSRGVKLLDKRSDAGHRGLGQILSNLGRLYLSSNRVSDAESALQRAYEVSAKTRSAKHHEVATALNFLALAEIRGGKYHSAELHLQQGLSIREESLGPNHPHTGITHTRLGEAYYEAGKLIDAEAGVRRGLNILEAHLGSDHSETAAALQQLGSILLELQNETEAFDLLQKAVIAQNKIQEFDASRFAGLDDVGAGKLAYSELVRAAWIVLAHRPERIDLKDIAFSAAQSAARSSASNAVSQMAARFGSEPGRLADLVRTTQDYSQLRAAIDRRLFASMANEIRDEASIASLRRELASVEDKLALSARRLEAEFPAYAAFVRPASLSSVQLAAELRHNEAFVTFFDVPKVGRLPNATFLWVVTREGSRWVRIPQGTAELTEKVQALRCGLDAQEWDGISRAARCGQLLGIDGQPEPGGPLPFHLGLAHELYQALLGPVEDLIRDKHLLIVPSGPLTSLPFQVLVTDKPATDQPKTYDDYKGVAWLGRRQPLTVLPSVSSLQALRKFAKTSTAQKPYVGYGNPVLQGDGACRTAVAPEACTPVLTAAVGSQAPARQHSLERSGSLDRIYRKGASQEAVLAEVRALCPLPDTAFELRCVARSLGVPESEVRLGATSTEADLKQRSEAGELANYRVVHFATHGLLAGDTEMMARRQGEPALVLTPPEAPRDMDDDGLLTASEVAQLKLNADWVILSACNTAAGDKLGAEALSGLARAFFYAGARALLVSHWPVYSDAAVELMDKAFAELRQDPSIGRSEALRRAMVALMDNPALSDNPHPSIWAPFSLVGEGAQ